MTPEFYFCLDEKLTEYCKNTEFSPEMFLPTRAHAKDTGYDVRCAEPNGMVIKPGCYFKIKLGLKMFAPDGWWLKLEPRSSSFTKIHIHALCGIIDELYEGDMVFAGQYLPDACALLSPVEELKIEFGKAIGQLIPFRRQDMGVNPLSTEEYILKCAQRKGSRGAGGFGSSDQK